MRDLIDQSLGRYFIVEKLGEGGMVLAYDFLVGKKVTSV